MFQRLKINALVTSRHEFVQLRRSNCAGKPRATAPGCSKIGSVEKLEICTPQPYRCGHDHDSFRLVSPLSFRVRSRACLELELIALRHQVNVLRHQRPGRLRLLSTDRLLWMWLYRIWPQVLNAVVLAKPATVVQWHRKGFRCYWRWRSRRPGRPKMSTEIRDLIRQMSLANPLWGAPRIHGELLKLGIEVSQPQSGDTYRGDLKSPPRPGVASYTTS
jgi:hypothetical protein